MGIYKYSLEKDVLVIKTGRGQYKFRIENTELLDNVDCIAGTLISELQGIDDKQGTLRDELSHYAKLLLATLNICEKHATLEKKYEQLNQTVETLQKVKSLLDHSNDSIAADRYGHISEKTYTPDKESQPNTSAQAKSPGGQQSPSISIPDQTNLSSESDRAPLTSLPAKASITPGARAVMDDSPAGGVANEANKQPKPGNGRAAPKRPSQTVPAVPSSAATVPAGRVHSGQRPGFHSKPGLTAPAVSPDDPAPVTASVSSEPTDPIKGKNLQAPEKTAGSGVSAVSTKKGSSAVNDVTEPFQSINPSAQYHLEASAGRIMQSGAAAQRSAPASDAPSFPSSPTVPDSQATSNQRMNSGALPGRAVSSGKAIVSPRIAGKSPAGSIGSAAPEPSEQPVKGEGPEKATVTRQSESSTLLLGHSKADTIEKHEPSKPNQSSSFSGRSNPVSSADRVVSAASTVSASPRHFDDKKLPTAASLSDRQETFTDSNKSDANIELTSVVSKPIISPPVAVRSSAKPLGSATSSSHVKRETFVSKEQETSSKLPQPAGRESLSNGEKTELTGNPVAPEAVQATGLSQRSRLVTPADRIMESASTVADSSSSASTAVDPVSSPSYVINTPERTNHKQLSAGAPVSAAGKYTLPLLSFLKNTCCESEVDRKRIRSDAELLEKKLGYFGIKGEVMGISPGPVITTYEYKPDPGIKISKIVNLADDLALALSAFSIRIVAPIPGKDVMGIEIPNIKKSLVPFIDIVTSDAFIQSTSKVPICLGKDIIGNPVVVELESMPHLLIAGATGTGKSVGLNAMITSILYKASPDDVKFLMIDPKRIELSFYNDIPHLLTPVITDMNKANIALQWMVREMDRRYNLLAHFQVRHIEQFNQKLAAAEVPQYDENGEQLESLPFIVVIIDELADLMMTASRDIEFSLTRLAQMARAAGIHLILATQRPSVDVLTGIIKANFPTRISFQVSSKTDSRTIIDSNGAETLLGNGDMLFVPPGTARLTRVHGTYLSEEELFDITTFIKKQRKPEYIFDVISEQVPNEVDSNFMDDEYDEKYNEALEVVMATRQASISGIQRALRVGYNRAARIIDLMEKKGVVGPSDGVKPRKVLANSMNMM